MEKFGLFSFSGIKSRQVFIDVTGSIMHYSEILELMPGENILLINHEDYAPAFGAIPVITEQGDDWVYEYPGMLGEGIYVAAKLKDLPGATFNRRKGTISVPSKGIYRAKVGNAYIFALDPDALYAPE